MLKNVSTSSLPPPDVSFTHPSSLAYKFSPYHSPLHSSSLLLNYIIIIISIVVTQYEALWFGVAMASAGWNLLGYQAAGRA